MVTANLGPDVPPDDGSDSAGIDRLTSALEKLEDTLKQKNRTIRYNPRDPKTPLTDVIGSNTRRVVQVEAERLTKKFVEITFTGSVTQGQLKKVNGEFKRFSDMLNKAVRQGFAKPKEREVALDKVQGALNLVKRVADKTSQAKLQAEQKKAEDQQVRDLRKSTKEQEAQRRRVQSALSSQRSREYAKDLSEEEKARKLWRRGLDKQAESASKEENAARRLWRRGLDRQESKKERSQNVAKDIKDALDLGSKVSIGMVLRASKAGLGGLALELAGKLGKQDQEKQEKKSQKEQDKAAKIEGSIQNALTMGSPVTRGMIQRALGAGLTDLASDLITKFDQQRRNNSPQMLFEQRLAYRQGAGMNLTKADLAKAIGFGDHGLVSKIEGILDAQERAANASKDKSKADKRAERATKVEDSIRNALAEGSAVSPGMIQRALDAKLYGLADELVGKRDKQKQEARSAKDQVKADRQLANMTKFVQDMETKKRNQAPITISDIQKGRKLGVDDKFMQGLEKSFERQKVTFFGGMFRNLAMGTIYQVMRPGMQVVTGTIEGFLAKPFELLNTLGHYANNAATQLSYMTGVAQGATVAMNAISTQQASMTMALSKSALTTDSAGQVGAGMYGSVGGLYGSAATTMLEAIKNPLTGLTDIVNRIGGAVALFNPGAMSRYSLVLRDVTAVIGAGLTPVVVGITNIMKMFGDYLKPVVSDALPAINQAMAELVTAIRPLIPTFVSMLKEALVGFINTMSSFAKNIGGATVVIERMAYMGRLFVATAVTGLSAAIGGAVAAIIPLLTRAVFAAIGTAILPGWGTMAGLAIGGLLGGYLSQGVMPSSSGKVAASSGMRMENSTGTAVASNARIGSAVDLGREASQQAFIASSNIGLGSAKSKTDSVLDLAEEWFIGQKANKPEAVSAKEGPGIASGTAPPAKAADPSKRYSSYTSKAAM